MRTGSRIGIWLLFDKNQTGYSIICMVCLISAGMPIMESGKNSLERLIYEKIYCVI